MRNKPRRTWRALNLVYAAKFVFPRLECVDNSLVVAVTLQQFFKFSYFVKEQRTAYCACDEQFLASANGTNSDSFADILL